MSLSPLNRCIHLASCLSLLKITTGSKLAPGRRKSCFSAKGELN